LCGGAPQSVAAALSRGGVPVVVATNQRLRASSSALFATAFYNSLVTDCTAEESVARARQAISPPAPDWSVPALHLATDSSDVIRFIGPTDTNIPSPPKKDFLGRQETMSRLDDALLD